MAYRLARGRGELAEFQTWMAQRHSGSSRGWPWLILKETFGAEADEGCLKTDGHHQLAVEHLCLRLRDFLGIPTAERPMARQAPSAADPDAGMRR